MSPLTSHLLLTLPLVVFVLAGLWAWSRMDRWCADAVDGDG